MTIALSGSNINVTGTESLANLKTFLTANSTAGSFNAKNIIFNFSLNVGASARYNSEDRVVYEFRGSARPNIDDTGIIDYKNDNVVLLKDTAKGHSYMKGNIIGNRLRYIIEANSGRSDFAVSDTVYTLTDSSLIAANAGDTFLHFQDDEGVLALSGTNRIINDKPNGTFYIEFDSNPDGTTKTYKGIDVSEAFKSGVTTNLYAPRTFSGAVVMQDFSLANATTTFRTGNSNSANSNIILRNPEFLGATNNLAGIRKNGNTKAATIEQMSFYPESLIDNSNPFNIHVQLTSGTQVLNTLVNSTNLETYVDKNGISREVFWIESRRVANTTTVSTRNTHDISLYRYDSLPIVLEDVTLNTPLEYGIEPQDDPAITETNTTTVAAYGITINHANETITVDSGATVTPQMIYDFVKLDKVKNNITLPSLGRMAVESSDGFNFDFYYELLIRGTLNHDPDTTKMSFRGFGLSAVPLIELLTGGIYNYGVATTAAGVTTYSAGEGIFDARSGLAGINGFNAVYRRSGAIIVRGGHLNWNGGAINSPFLVQFETGTATINAGTVDGRNYDSNSSNQAVVWLQPTFGRFEVNGLKIVSNTSHANGIGFFLSKAPEVFNGVEHSNGAGIGTGGTTLTTSGIATPVIVKDYEAISPVLTVGIWRQNYIKMINHKTGSEAIIGGMLPGSDQFNLGFTEFYKELGFKITDETGANLAGAKAYLIDVNNGNRQADYRGYSWSADRSYTWTTAADGTAAAQEVLIALFLRRTGGDRFTGIQSDYRTDNNDNTDVMSPRIIHYLKDIATAPTTLKGKGVYTQGWTLFPDAIITESNSSTVAAYTSISNAEEFYDYAKLHLVNNYFGEAETLVSRNKTTILSDLNIRFVDDYSETTTYAVGDVVHESGNIFKNTTAITTAEAFTASKWQQLRSGIMTVDGNTIYVKGSANYADDFELNVNRTVTSAGETTLSGGIVDGNGNSFLSFGSIDSWEVFSTDARTTSLGSGTGSDIYRFNFVANTSYYLDLVVSGEKIEKTVTPTASGELEVNLGQTSQLIAINAAISAINQTTKYLPSEVFVDTTLTPDGNGSHQSPYNSMADALSFADANNVDAISILSNATLSGSLTNHHIRANKAGVSIALGGQSLVGSSFSDLEMTGACSGAFETHDCKLTSITGLEGKHERAILVGNNIPNGTCTVFNSSSSGQSTSFDLTGKSNVLLELYNVSGKVTIKNSAASSNIIHIASHNCEVVIESNCTAGVANIVSAGAVTNNSTMTVNDVSVISALETKAQADTRQTALTTAISGLNNISAADVWAATTRTLTDKAGFSLTTAERSAISTAVETSILDESDGKAVLNAIVGAIGNTNISQVSFVAAIRADLERTGGAIKIIESNTNNIPTNLEVINDNVKDASLIIPADRSLTT